MGIITGLVQAVLLLGGLIAAIKPSLLGATSRWSGLGLISLSLAAGGFSRNLPPDWPSIDLAANIAAVAMIGFGALALFFFSLALNPKPAQPITDESQGETISAQLRQCVVDDRELPLNDRLSRAFWMLDSGKIKLEDYHSTLLEENEQIDLKLENLASIRPTISAEKYELECQKLVEGQRAIGWRINWVQKQLLALSNHGEKVR